MISWEEWLKSKVGGGNSLKVQISSEMNIFPPIVFVHRYSLQWSMYIFIWACSELLSQRTPSIPFRCIHWQSQTHSSPELHYTEAHISSHSTSQLNRLSTSLIWMTIKASSVHIPFQVPLRTFCSKDNRKTSTLHKATGHTWPGSMKLCSQHRESSSPQ